MPSIRRSLIIYFLLLLAVALTGMAFLADSVTGRALEEREESGAKLIEVNAQEREREARDSFDRELLAQARTTHRSAVGEWAVHVEQVKTRSETVIPLILFGLGTAPSHVAPFAAAVNVQATHAPQPGRRNWVIGPLVQALVQAVVQANVEELTYADFLSRHLGEPDAPLVQINNSARGLVWKSTALPADGLPFERTAWEAFGEDVRYDTLDLPAGPVRRVIFRTPTVGGPRWSGWVSPPRTEPRVGGGREGQNPPPPPRPPSTGPNINYYHVARPTTDLDAAVADITADAAREKEKLRASTAATRRWVQLLLLAGSTFAFIGLLVGGWVLVSVGLRPLRKLTDAVSRVSEKDLRLPVEARELSHELVPIHHRLAQALDELRQAFDREKQAVADISHELRTPVASLLATIDITLRKPRSADQLKQALEDCRVLTKQLGGLVERVMTLAYLDAGQTPVAVAPTDAAEVASGCAAVIRPLAESQGLTLSTDLQPTPPLDTDSDKLREVMINLLHNAVEYNRPGGSVRLAVRREANGGPLVVEVSDTGIGMTPEVKGRIFERFYRADSSRTATGAHAGLGLAIVKEYVTRLGGTISVESELDRGSTFRVTLPV